LLFFVFRSATVELGFEDADRGCERCTPNPTPPPFLSHLRSRWQSRATPSVIRILSFSLIRGIAQRFAVNEADAADLGFQIGERFSCLRDRVIRGAQENDDYKFTPGRAPVLSSP